MGRQGQGGIVSSVLPADFARLGQQCQALEKAGADRIQWDVMDGRFVPNLTFGPDVIAAARHHVTLPFEAHLMVVEPDALVARTVRAGCEIVIVHAETCVHLHRTLAHVREEGARAGIAFNPATPLDVLDHVLDLVDLVLVMTVNPGFGGQQYLSSMEPKIAEARRRIDAAGRDVDLEVDGGIGPTTIAAAAAAGADMFCAGSALFNPSDGFAAAISDLRDRVQHAYRRVP